MQLQHTDHASITCYLKTSARNPDGIIREHSGRHVTGNTLAPKRQDMIFSPGSFYCLASMVFVFVVYVLSSWCCLICLAVLSIGVGMVLFIILAISRSVRCVFAMCVVLSSSGSLSC